MEKSQVVEFLGGVKQTADFLNVSYSAVHKWGAVIPEKQALLLERRTNGELKYRAELYLAKRKGSAGAEKEAEDAALD